MPPSELERAKREARIQTYHLSETNMKEYEDSEKYNLNPRIIMTKELFEEIRIKYNFYSYQTNELVVYDDR